ncbi:MAG TPA: signal peptidase I, partial [Candidatus Limnocylindria bacterium]|nr:signal peptidase I [Candidatus Limnocylindria bacterium]
MGKHAAPAEGTGPAASTMPPAPGAPPATAAGRFWAGLRETGVLLALALGLAVVLRTFVVQAFFVPSESMVPTLLKDDRIVVSKLSTDLGGVDRGQVVVFRDPGDWLDVPPSALTGVRKAMVSSLTFVGLLPSDSGD